MIGRLRCCDGEAGFTLIELLVALVMGVVVMGAVASLVISAVRTQPKISGQAQNITTARWVLERMTHELRNGVAVKEAAANKVSFEGYVRHTTCGGTTPLPSTTPAIKCRVTFECTTTSCSRREGPASTGGGTAKTIFSGINTDQVFTYAPTATEPPSATEPTYVKVTLRLPNPSGTGALTVSDGASLRNATLGY